MARNSKTIFENPIRTNKRTINNCSIHSGNAKNYSGNSWAQAIKRTRIQSKKNEVLNEKKTKKREDEEMGKENNIRRAPAAAAWIAICSACNRSTSRRFPSHLRPVFSFLFPPTMYCRLFICAMSFSLNLSSARENVLSCCGNGFLVARHWLCLIFH